MATNPTPEALLSRHDRPPKDNRQPFLGPQPFQEEDRFLFFGRKREVQELAARIVAHSDALLYAPSGAGKTSLLNAGVIPWLKDPEKGEDCDVLPLGRVQGPPPRGIPCSAITNPYVFYTLLSWSKQQEQPHSENYTRQLTAQSLDEFLAALPRTKNQRGRPRLRVAIFDQFEEIFTSYRECWSKRQEFFEQVGKALEADPLLRVVFSIREDYLASFDRYAGFLPEKLRTRFRLERLRPEAALEAITKPLIGTGREFARGVAEELVKRLRTVEVKPLDGPAVAVEEEFIEPVQLQVVCQNLWQELPPDANEINFAHLKFADVKGALARFYDKCVLTVVQQTQVKEGRLRQWFEDQLITPAGTRNLIFRDPTTPSRENQVMDLLQDLYLLRSEVRDGDQWFELTHERLILPIREANRAWRNRTGVTAAQQSLQQLTEKARRWRDRERREGFLNDRELLQADRDLAAWQAIGQDVEEELLAFVDASRAALKDAARTRRHQERTAWLIIGLIVALALGLIAWNRKELAERAEIQAVEQKEAAEEANRDAKRSVAKLAISQGKQLLESEDVSGALLWYAEALNEDPPDPNREPIHRARLGIAVRQLPRLVQMIPHRNLNQVEMSPDGLRLLTVGSFPTGGDDDPPQVCRVWEVATGKELWRYPHEGRTLHKAAFGPDGWSVVTAAETQAGRGEVAVWDVKSQRKEPRWSANQDSPVTSAAFRPRRDVDSAGGKRVQLGGAIPLPDFASLLALPSLPRKPEGPDLVLTVSGPQGGQEGPAAVPFLGTRVVGLMGSSAGPGPLLTAPFLLLQRPGVARLWDARTGKDLRTVPHPGGGVVYAAFSPDGHRLVTLGGDSVGPRGLRVWEVGTLLPKEAGSEPRALNAGEEVNRAAAHSADRSRGGRLDATTGTIDPPLASFMDLKGANYAAFSPPDGRFLITFGGREMTEAYVLDLRAPRAAPRVLRHEHLVTAAAFSPDGRLVVTTTDDGMIRVWGLEHGQLRLVLRQASSVYGASFSPDGRLLVTAGRDQTARVWDVATGKLVLPPLNDYGTATQAFFSLDGRRVVTQNRDTARVWELTTSQPVPVVLSPGTRVNGGALSPDGRLAVTIGMGLGDYPREVSVWDARTGRQQQKFHHGQRFVTHAVFSPDGRRVVTAGWQEQELWGAAWLWDVETGEELKMFGLEQGAVTFAAFDREGKRLVTATDLDKGKRGQAQIWDVASGIGGQKFPHDGGAVTFAAFSPQGDRLVTASTDDTAKVWRVSTGELLLTLKHTADVTHASFSPTEDLILTAGADLKAVLWDSGSGQVRAELRHSSYLERAAFSPDGRRILTAGRDGTVRVWDVSSHSLVAILRHWGIVQHASFGGWGDRAFTLSYYLPPALLAAPGLGYSPEAEMRRSGAGGYLHVREWDLSAYMGSIPDAQLVSELIAARKYDRDLAELVSIKPPDLGERWQGVRGKYQAVLPAAAPDAASPGHNDPDWHARQAVESEAAGQWLTAAWHLGRMIARRPRDPDLFRRRARAYAELGEWDRAGVDYSQAIVLRPKDVSLWVGRGQTYAEQGAWAKAVAAFSFALKLNPDKESTERAIDIRYYLALAELGGGDHAGYRAACADMLQNLVPKPSPMDTNLTAWTCLLNPDSGADVGRLVQLAEHAATADPGMREYSNTLGAAFYRARRWEEAIRRLEDALNMYRGQGAQQAQAAEPEDKRQVSQFGNGTAWDWWFLAMAYQRTGDAAKASKWLNRAATWTDKALLETRQEGRRPVLPWYDRLELRLLRREAEDLLNAKKP